MQRQIVLVMALSAFCMSVWSAPQKEKGLAAYWDFKEGEGNVLSDKSGNSNQGKIRGAAFVKVGERHALRFDGKDDYVYCGRGRSLNLADAVTVEVWVYADKVPDAEPGIAGKGIGTYGLTYYKNGKVWWYISGGDNAGMTPMKPGSWHYVAGTFDGKEMRIYLDGKLKWGGASKKAKIVENKATPFYIGCGFVSRSPAGFFAGMIGEVRVYNRALQAAEVLSHYEKNRASFGLEK